MTTEAKRRECYRKINRRVIRQLENECGDRILDLIDELQTAPINMISEDDPR